MQLIKKILTDQVLWLTTISIFGLFYYNFDLIGPSLLVAYIISGFMPIIVHEGWSHNKVRPKNIFITVIMDFCGYLLTIPNKSSVSPRLMWIVVHNHHHKNWKNEDDGVQWGIDNNHALAYMFTSNFRKVSKRILTVKKIIQETSKYQRNLNKISVWIDNNWKNLLIAFHIIMLFTLGIKYYFYFVLFPVWLINSLTIFFGDILPHINKKTRDEEFDMPWVFPIALTSAYHISHHKYVNQLNLGPGWVKYFNIQYYFILLFFKINATIRIL